MNNVPITHMCLAPSSCPLQALGPDFSGTVFVPVTDAYTKLAAALGVSSPADLMTDVQTATVVRMEKVTSADTCPNSAAFL